MKTVTKTIALAAIIFSAGNVSAQLGLGVNTATQTAVNATAATGTVLQTSQAATMATKATVNASATTINAAKSTTGAAVNTGLNASSQAAGELRSAAANTNIQTGLNTSVSGSGNANLTAGNSNLQTGISGQSQTDAAIQVNGAKLLEKTDAAGNKVTTTVSNTTDAAIQKGGEVKTATTATVKTELKAAKETAAGSGSAQASSNTNVTVIKQ